MPARPYARPLAAVILATCASAASAEITAIPLPALDWTKTPEGVAFAPLDGDWFAEPYMAMVELPAGLVSPAHTKTADMFGLVISGTMTHVPAKASPADGKALGPGAYYHIPAGLPHISSCVSDTPCVTFLHQPGAFDFLPVTP